MSARISAKDWKAGARSLDDVDREVVPFFIRLDANGDPEGDPQALTMSDGRIVALRIPAGEWADWNAEEAFANLLSQLAPLPPSTAANGNRQQRRAASRKKTEA